jgi:hypothetical protein
MVLGVSFLLTNRTSYGHADSLEEAKSAFRREYLGVERNAKDAHC